MGYRIIQIDEQTWRMEELGVRFFLLTGSREALLVDSGMEVHNALEIAQTLTKLPVKLLNTHADMDHIGSNAEFETAYMHPAECFNYYKGEEAHGGITPVWDGDIIDIGDRPLEVISLPGHTPGSIALLDQKRRVLISGDPVQDGAIFMFGPQREVHAYQYSLEKLEKMSDRFDLLYPSHGRFPIAPSQIGALHEGMERILKGEIVPESVECFGTMVKRYDVGVAAFLMDM